MPVFDGNPGNGADFVIVMGVAGCGKTEVATRLARALSCPFIEADRWHSAENVERMRRGIGLTDNDRWPWLAAVCEAATSAASRPVVIACSALRKSYRDFIRGRLGMVSFVFLEGDE